MCTLVAMYVHLSPTWEKMSDLSNFLLTSAEQRNMCFPLQRGFLNNGIISAKSSSEHDFLLGKIVADLKGQSEGKREKERQEERGETGGKTLLEGEIKQDRADMTRRERRR